MSEEVQDDDTNIRQYAMIGLNFSNSLARLAKGAILGLRNFAGKVADIVDERNVCGQR